MTLTTLTTMMTFTTVKAFKSVYSNEFWKSIWEADKNPKNLKVGNQWNSILIIAEVTASKNP